MTNIASVQPEAFPATAAPRESSVADIMQSVIEASFQSTRSGGNLVTRSEGNDTPHVNSTNQVPLIPPEIVHDLTLLLKTVQVKLNELGIKTGKEDAKQLGADVKQRHKEAMEALQKSIA